MSRPDAAGPTGLLVVDKPGGMTSHDVVSRVRRLAGTRKVGHAGTLDPMATGVLVLGVGRATRLLGHLVLGEKAYDATVRLGASTVTDDAEGDVTGGSPAGDLDPERVRRVLAGFAGELDQVPTAVSAVKVAGRRAHERVRAGEDVRLEPRRVTVHELRVGEPRRAGAAYLDVDVTLRCSAGTYVRAVARDAGEALGVGGHLTALRRTAVGPFGLDAARTLEQLADELPGAGLLGLADAARAAFPILELGDEDAAAVRHGRALDVDLPAAGPVAVLGPDGAFLALYAEREGRARAVAVLA